MAAAFALRKQRQLLQPGPDAPYSELSANLGWLLLGSVLMQTLAYSPLLAVNILADSYGEEGKLVAAGFASAFFVARVPVLAFQAVQGTLLPKLAGLSGSGRHDEFKRGLNRLLAMVVGIAVLGTILAFLLGPVGRQDPVQGLHPRRRGPRPARRRQRRVHHRPHPGAGPHGTRRLPDDGGLVGQRHWRCAACSSPPSTGSSCGSSWASSSACSWRRR